LQREGEDPDEYDTGLAPSALAAERRRPIETPWGTLAIYRVPEDGGELVAADAFCPHLLGPLFQGTQSGAEIACPWHYWRFSLRSGACTWPGALIARGARIKVAAVVIGARGTLVIRRPAGAGARPAS
jgi:nitrite reductase/ring-hydroxylating ferredoxin subunit